MIQEILTNCGIDTEKANEIVKAMGEAKVYTTAIENADVRYNKLKEQNKNLDVQVKDYSSQLETLSKNNKDNAELTKQIEQLQLSNKSIVDEYEKKIFDQEYNFALDKTLEGAKSLNNKALRALIDFDKVNYQEGKFEGLEEQINALKESDSYLFKNDTPASTGGVGNFGRSNGKVTMSKEEFNKMTYQERNALYQENKDLYNELSK